MTANSTNSKNRVIRAFAGRLSRLPVARHPGLLFNPWLEGYRDYSFGGRAGPSVAVSNVFHELAHAAQFSAEVFRHRATPDGFVFKLRKVFVYDRFCVEPRSMGAVARELDTFAHQLHLMRLAGFKVQDSDYFMDAAYLGRYMADWYHVPGDCDDTRALHCMQMAAERYAQLTEREVLDKLEGWLDATHKRMVRQGKSLRRAHCPVQPRFRPDCSQAI